MPMSVCDDRPWSEKETNIIVSFRTEWVHLGSAKIISYTEISIPKWKAKEQTLIPLS